MTFLFRNNFTIVNRKLQWEGEGIAINCINPERTHTPMRTSNFGAEDLTTLLDAANVAKAALATLMSDVTGQVVDIKVKDFRK